MKPEQLALDLPLRPALGRDDFVVTRANTEALAMVESDVWPGGRLALIGPAAAGKTHLAHVWAAQAEAVILPATDLPRYDVITLAGAGRVAVEDVPAIAGDRRAETALFHLRPTTRFWARFWKSSSPIGGSSRARRFSCSSSPT